MCDDYHDDDEEEDDDSDDDDYEAPMHLPPQDRGSYVPTQTPWVVELKQRMRALLNNDQVSVSIVSPPFFKEVGFTTFEAFMATLCCDSDKGSINRYIARVYNGGELRYFLVKQVSQLIGQQESRVGVALTQVYDFPTFIPPILGYDSLPYEATGPVHYVVIPWVMGLSTLSSFLNNHRPVELNLTTRDILKPIGRLLRDMDTAFKKAGFIHLDMHNGQILVGINPLRLYLIDFGIVKFDAMVNGQPVLVNPREVSDSSASYHEMITLLVRHTLNNLVLANKKGRDEAMRKAWRAKTVLFAKHQVKLDSVYTWIESL